MLKFIKPLPILITIATATGILSHEMHIDRATTVAFSTPAIAAATSTGAGYEKVISQNYHTHVERTSLPKVNTSFRSSLPTFSPTRDEDRRYIQSKKLLLMGGGDTTSLWPSV